MKIYYAIFYPLETGWGVRFPDAESINTGGSNLDEALAMATDALSGLMVVGRKGREYQDPRSYDKIKREAVEGELVFPVVPDEKIMEEYRPKKRINVMVPVDLLEKVGEVVKKSEDLDRSKLFCAAVEQYLSGGDEHHAQ
ncbi:MAG: type II toxin-antitoxin system HicB family antitoxin [Thermodesulfobacteriota bacterium]